MVTKISVAVVGDGDVIGDRNNVVGDGDGDGDVGDNNVGDNDVAGDNDVVADVVGYTDGGVYKCNDACDYGNEAGDGVVMMVMLLADVVTDGHSKDSGLVIMKEVVMAMIKMVLVVLLVMLLLVYESEFKPKKPNVT